ncbi:hypothetical protein R5R35_012485 [Gryllus longicercus]|uniref:Uncharacterized protein n=1 Tax=Gryllus longicercus TaxID=2509291 RepID=A0AAN9VQ99_9ORTH
MAETGTESRKSKKSKHKKSPSKTEIFNSVSGSATEEQDESETDLNKSLFKLPHHHRTVSKSPTTNGDVSDSETDLDKPLKRTTFHKSVQEIQNTNNNAQSAMERSDNEESGDEQLSMSLLQFRPAKIVSEKRSNQSNANSPKSGHNSLSASGSLKSKVHRKPSAPEMSESDSDKETNHHHHTQPQRPPSQPESGSEEEEEEDEHQNEQNLERHNRHHQPPQQQFVSTLNPLARIKEEVHSNSESSSFEEDDPPALQEFQNTSLVPHVESRRISSQSTSTPQNPRGGVIDRNHSSNIATFEQEHTRISAPVIDIPQDSRVWVLQVPRSIEAIHLHGRYLPKKLKGGEVLNLPSGSWQIMEQPYEASRSALNCIVSTGNFSYGMRWLQPRGFWFFKRLRKPLQMETTDAPWTQEITPLPIKELLKMKSNAAISKDQHLKPSKKRHRNSDLDLPSKQSKMIPKELSSKEDESMHKKVKHNHETSVKEDSSIQGGEAEKGKKRKRSSDANVESPNKKKKKRSSEVYEQSHLKDVLPQSQSISVDVNRSMTSPRAENISFNKEKKMSKHNEICDESLKRLKSPVKITKVKQEITENDSEWMEHSSLNNLSGSSSDEKQRKHKKSHVELEVKDTSFEVKQNESRETSDKKKKKKGKQSNESVQRETFQAPEKKIELASPPNSFTGTEKPMKKEKEHSQQSETSVENTDGEVRKKKKHKHHKHRGEDEVPAQKTEKDISVKKKKKHKHKESDVPKVKQENFWERETSPDFLSHLYLTQATPEDV